MIHTLQGILLAALAFALFKWFIHSFGLKVLGAHMKQKGTPTPTDEELRELIKQQLKIFKKVK